ncbi:hypothetical protein BH23GEM9_BH23GEM9_03570 [soil metagenome]
MIPGPVRPVLPGRPMQRPSSLKIRLLPWRYQSPQYNAMRATQILVLVPWRYQSPQYDAMPAAQILI